MRSTKILTLGAALACIAIAQTAVPTVTLTAPMAIADTTGSFSSTAGWLPRDTTVNTELYMDHELIQVISVSPLILARGVDTSRQSSHATNAKAWWGPPSYFWKSEPSGACSSLNVTPVIVVPSGDQWGCPSSGPNAGFWSKVGLAQDQAYVFSDGVKYNTPGGCLLTAGTGTVGTAYATIRTAANVTVGQMTVGASGNGTFLATCDVTEGGRYSPNKGSTITGVTLLYGAQTAAITSIAAGAVSTVAYPAAGVAAGATVTTAGGTLTVAPASLVLTTTTSGQCNAETISFGTPISPANLQRITFEQSFTLANSTILQICGLIVNYTSAPL